MDDELCVAVADEETLYKTCNPVARTAFNLRLDRYSTSFHSCSICLATSLLLTGRYTASLDRVFNAITRNNLHSIHTDPTIMKITVRCQGCKVFCAPEISADDPEVKKLVDKKPN